MMKDLNEMGGSYTRQADGSLKLTARTAAAEPPETQSPQQEPEKPAPSKAPKPAKEG
jgi:hypothetical protein